MRLPSTVKETVRYLLTKKVKVSRFLISLWKILLLSISLTVAITVIIIVKVIEAKNNSKLSMRSIQKFGTKVDSPFKEGCFIPLQYIQDPSYSKQNATLMMLTRNTELEDVIKSMKSLETHFNQWFQYPWTFLNDDEFSSDFKQTVQQYTKAKVEFGQIPKSHWEFPDVLRESWAFKEGIETQGDRGIMYGSMESYHKMCRFFSGFFYKHPLIRKYEWYWRVEPDVDFYCDLTYDPFFEMHSKGKKYGFTVMIRELVETVPNLFRVTKAFLKQYDLKPKSSWNLFVSNFKSHVKYKNHQRYQENYKNIQWEEGIESRMKEVLKVESFVKGLKSPLNTDKNLNKEAIGETIARAKDVDRMAPLMGEQIDGEEYNLLHFWSNFEIARVDLWDNEIYEKYFSYLENQGGFFKERWGDAPVHSIAVGMLLDIEDVHYFRDIGYRHSTIFHCPANHPKQLDYERNSKGLAFSEKSSIFGDLWSKEYDQPKEYGVGCKCKCPTNLGHDIEDSESDFFEGWIHLMSGKSEKWLVDLDLLERKIRKSLKSR